MEHRGISASCEAQPALKEPIWMLRRHLPEGVCQVKKRKRTIL
jgi:hypothetical protein